MVQQFVKISRKVRGLDCGRGISRWFGWRGFSGKSIYSTCLAAGEFGLPKHHLIQSPLQGPKTPFGIMATYTSQWLIPVTAGSRSNLSGSSLHAAWTPRKNLSVDKSHSASAAVVS